ncbi:MAG TPA: histidinol dehydrogenase [Acidobacteriaceae bacterium]|nr:histidinol dehydrogenase [Acidobacteriaceae bacterium]
MRLIRTNSRSAAALKESLVRRGNFSLDSVQPAVKRIVADVRKRGDSALVRYAMRFDKLQPNASLRVEAEETASAWATLDAGLKRALERAAKQIRGFAERQSPKSWMSTPAAGLKTGQLVRPIDAAACYVPGGRHPLPSTMLMTAIPAQVAGVPRIAVFSPNPAQETLATAHLLGVTEIYRIGGAHAIAAAAYGTESIAPVSKIVGPGNLYVTAAKRMVAQERGPGSIDMLAGPTEIVVTSEEGKPASIAADLIAQAEHDPATLSIFLTTQEPLARAVIAAVKEQSRSNATAKEALKQNGYVLLCKTVEEARAWTNAIAPEHLTVDSAADLDWVQNAGSVFVGRYSPQPMGDYISGPNHTLPTGGTARFRGGLSVNDFLKLITVQEYTRIGLERFGADAIRLAEAEGLVGHAAAIRERIAEE